MYQKRRKIIASMLIFMLTVTHLSVIGEVLATSLENQSTKTNNANVEFDTYFTNNNQKVHSAIKNIGEENYLYTQISVKAAGYLKNAVITADNANFKMLETLENKQVSKIENNKIYFNQIKSGNTQELAIPIEIPSKEQIEPEQFSKESKLKLTATYVDGNGKEKQIEKEIAVKLSWTKEKQAELNMQVSKFVPYNIATTKGVLLQTIVKSYLKDNVLPVKENKVEIEVPTINNIKPQEVKVLANTTKATNGDETGKNFASTNYTYDKEANKLTITVNNEENSQGKISWKKDAQDEFVVNYIYPEEALNSITQEGTKVKINANSELTIYEASQTKANKTFEGEITLKDQIGNLIDFEIATNVENISKGQIYANYQTENKIETDYKQTITANVGLVDLVDKIVLEQNTDNFITEVNTKSEAKQTYYKKIVVDKTEFDKILGEDGKISFYQGTTQIAKIDKETQANEQGKFEVNLSELNINSLRIETSKPQSEGRLNFEVLKAIKGDVSYSKAEMKNFKALELNLSAKVANGEVNFIEQNLTKEITFVEPTSQAELIIDKANLSTVVTNENVKITAILKTDTLNCNLYQNPTLAITLPSYIENINIKNIETFFETEGSKLTLKGHQLITNADGTKTILVTLEGTQTQYSLGAMSKGLNVVITSDITVNKLTPNKQEQITMVYTNDNVITNARAAAKETNQITTPVTFVAPTGVITTTEISNYKEGSEPLTSISGEEKTATIETMVEARNATFTMNLINNYNNTIDTISILGRTPFAQNKNITTKEDLSSTNTMPLTSNITVSNVDASKVAIYYSENGEATKDLNVASNGWTLTPTDLGKVKSYLIVLTDYAMNTADKISFTYNAQIPANLQHNQSAYQTYVAYFNNNLATGKVEDKAVAAKVGLSTGTGPVIEASLVSNIKETEQILPDSIIKYTLTVKNTGTEVAKNVVAKIDIPEYIRQVKESETSPTGYETIVGGGQTLSIEMGEISPNTTKREELLMKSSNLTTTENTMQIETKAIITADEITGQIETNSVKNTLVKVHYIVTPTMLNTDEILKEQDSFTCYMEIVSSDIDEQREETTLEVTIPNEVQYEGIEIANKVAGNKTDITSQVKYNYNKNNRKLVVNLGTVNGEEIKAISIKLKAGNLEQNTYNKTVNLDAMVYGKDTTKQQISLSPIEIGKVGLKITQTSNITENERIQAYEDFKYIYTIENLSNMDLYGITFTNILPKEVEFGSIKITYADGTTSTKYDTNSDGNPLITLNLQGKEKVTIEVSATAKAIEADTKITNKAQLEYTGIDTITTNTISHTIVKYEEGQIDPSTNTNKRISGQIWLDNNKNGMKDEDEDRISDIEVMLFNNVTATLVRDEQGNVLKPKTDNEGKYVFSNIPQGKYTVIFLYDTANFSATTYKAQNIDEALNSDAIDTKITLDGITRMAAITEEIDLSSTNLYNIDLGLVTNPKFDLSLNKTVSKIILQNSKGTTTVEYDNTKLAKKDIPEKQINGTTVIIEYKIAITNEGAISGYVKKIADYIPAELSFNADLNKDWYNSENGVIFNSSLANTLINPGETKEVTLLLTKKLTQENIGLYNNTAEIYEAYNDLGIKDIDSTPANKVSSEDDMSSADVLISVKTGQVILFVGLTITIIATIGIGAYFIKKKVIK